LPINKASMRQTKTPMDDFNAEKLSYINSGLKSDQAVHLVEILEKYMKTEKPYIDSDLNISDLSARLNIPKHHLTEVINTS
jgi:hypothetical protein